MEYLTYSLQETCDLAHKIAQKSHPGDIYALFGQLGSGKTIFAQGFARSLGVKKTVTSPTFNIFKSYKTKRPDISLNHLDCYRISSFEDAYSIGLPDIISDKKSISIIEWPEKILGILPENIIKIKFKYVDQKTRKITIKKTLLSN